jgi:hypothetical protein
MGRLARKINFDVSDYKTWAQASDDAPIPGKPYTIPNTIYLDIGRYSFLDIAFGAIGLSKNAAFAFAQQAKSAGYQTTTRRICSVKSSRFPRRQSHGGRQLTSTTIGPGRAHRFFTGQMGAVWRTRPLE